MRLTSGLLALLLVAAGARAQQSNNHVLHAVPTPGKVAVDGKLDDWDLSGCTEVFAHFRMRSTYSAKVAAMYDAQHFYLSLVWRDPTPLFNMVDARFDVGSGWKSDCVQLRVITDVVMHIDCWYSAAAKQPVVNIAYGSLRRGSPNHSDKLANIADAIKAGAREAFAMGADGKSYTQELALPWKLITGQSAIVKATGKPFAPPRAYKAGDNFRMGMEFLWGGSDGKTWPIHRYADFLAEGHTSREFFWTAEDAWGTVKLEPKGRLSLPQPDYGDTTAFLQKGDGPVEIRYQMPFDGFTTIVVEDKDGRRVRNLVGMAPREKGQQVERWDGLDEKGNIAKPGSYTWRGLVHQGIDPVYEATYGNPGSPPWSTADGSGAWMSDHNPPVAVAAGKDIVALAASGSEAGWALIGTDLNGRKRWGVRKFQAIRALAVDDEFVYAGMAAAERGFDVRPFPTVGRTTLKSGKYAPFTTPEPQLIVPVAKQEEKANLAGLAIHAGRLAVALTGIDAVRFFDRKTMKRLGQVAVPRPGGLTFDAEGTLFVVSGKSVVKLVDEKTQAVVRDHLDKPYDVAVDSQGRLFVTDRGSQQIKAFDRTGKFLRAIGVAGGRPKPGKWVAGGLRNPADLDVDAKGRIWVAEEDLHPKRISVWSADGTLVTDFIGPTVYGGMGGFADAQDKTRLFGSACEWRLDYKANRARVVANCLSHQVSGDLLRFRGREYVMAKKGELFVRRGDVFAPVARYGAVREPEVDGVALPLEDANAKGPFNYVWSDLDDDGTMEPAEIAVETGGKEQSAGYWGGYWLDEEFNLYAIWPGYRWEKVSRLPLARLTKGGAPVWDLGKRHIYVDAAHSGTAPEGLLLVDKGMPIVAQDPIKAFRPDGTVAWTYANRWSNVHGSHRAPMPASDAVLVGVLGCIGRADTPIGRVFAMNSNMGRLYVMTTDGLLVANVFQDSRMGAAPWPNEAKAGSPLGAVSMGSEWFGGYFFRAEKTNEYYLIAGGVSYCLIRLDGFPSLRRIEGGRVEVGTAQVAAAEQLLRKRAAASAASRKLAITRLANAPTLDGRLNEYPKERFAEWAAGTYKARAAVAVHGGSLCLAYDVSGDANPMVNGGQDPTHLFVTGDSVDLQLGTDPAADPKRTQPVLGDLRLLISVHGGKPIAVLYRWKAKDKARQQVFRCPWRSHTVDSVEVLADAKIHIARHGGRYIVEAAVPLATLGFAPQPGKAYRLDLGVIYSDAKGTNRAARVYWANKATGLTADVPGEIMANPNLWGTASLGK